MLMLVLSFYKILWCMQDLCLKNITYLQDFLSNQKDVIGDFKNCMRSFDVCFSHDIVRVIKQRGIEVGGACAMRRTNACMILVIKLEEIDMLGRAGPR